MDMSREMVAEIMRHLSYAQIMKTADKYFQDMIFRIKIRDEFPDKYMADRANHTYYRQLLIGVPKITKYVRQGGIQMYFLLAHDLIMEAYTGSIIIKETGQVGPFPIHYCSNIYNAILFHQNIFIFCGPHGMHIIDKHGQPSLEYNIDLGGMHHIHTQICHDMLYIIIHNDVDESPHDVYIVDKDMQITHIVLSSQIYNIVEYNDGLLILTAKNLFACNINLEQASWIKVPVMLSASIYQAYDRPLAYVDG